MIARLINRIGRTAIIVVIFFYIIVPFPTPITAGVFNNFNRLCQHHLNGGNRVFLNGNGNLGGEAFVLHRKIIIAAQYPRLLGLLGGHLNTNTLPLFAKKTRFAKFLIGIITVAVNDLAVICIGYNDLIARFINRIGRIIIIVVIFFYIIVPFPIPITAGIFDNFNRLCQFHLNGGNRVFDNRDRYLGSSAQTLNRKIIITTRQPRLPVLIGGYRNSNTLPFFVKECTLILIIGIFYIVTFRIMDNNLISRQKNAVT